MTVIVFICISTPLFSKDISVDTNILDKRREVLEYNLLKLCNGLQELCNSMKFKIGQKKHKLFYASELLRDREGNLIQYENLKSKSEEGAFISLLGDVMNGIFEYCYKSNNFSEFKKCLKNKWKKSRPNEKPKSLVDNLKEKIEACKEDESTANDFLEVTFNYKNSQIDNLPGVNVDKANIRILQEVLYSKGAQGSISDSFYKNKQSSPSAMLSGNKNANKKGLARVNHELDNKIDREKLTGKLIKPTSKDDPDVKKFLIMLKKRKDEHLGKRVFAYSGHGVPCVGQNIEKSNCIVLPTIPAKYILFESIVDAYEPDHIFLDSCHSGAGVLAVNYQKKLSGYNNQTGFSLIASSSGSQVAADDSLRGGRLFHSMKSLLSGENVCNMDFDHDGEISERELSASIYSVFLNQSCISEKIRGLVRQNKYLEIASRTQTPITISKSSCFAKLTSKMKEKCGITERKGNEHPTCSESIDKSAQSFERMQQVLKNPFKVFSTNGYNIGSSRGLGRLVSCDERNRSRRIKYRPENSEYKQHDFNDVLSFFDSWRQDEMKKIQSDCISDKNGKCNSSLTTVKLKENALISLKQRFLEIRNFVKKKIIKKSKN